MWAPMSTVVKAALAVGVLTDLCHLVPAEGGTNIAVVGPRALGFMLGAYSVATLRALVFRKNPLTITVLFAVGGCVAAALTAGLLTIRSITDSTIVVMPGTLMWEGLGSAAYSAVAAFFLSPLQRVLIPVLGFRKAASMGIDRWS
ncbi:MAG TPA: hypothetical protein VG816_10690, partial [Solirubrobacterales bacterium]|nr:hypothetical protein [Solirubrobacterales bacterium]